MDGFSSSIRDLRTHDIILHEIKGCKYKLIWRRGNAFRFGTRAIRKFIVKNQSKDNILLLVGKSLGGKEIINNVLNKLPTLNYSTINLLTLDPCWPLLTDWTPNLNDYELEVTYPINKGINLQVIGTPNQQCGAKVVGPNIKNVEIFNSDHYSIIVNPEVKVAIRRLIFNTDF